MASNIVSKCRCDINVLRCHYEPFLEREREPSIEISMGIKGVWQICFKETMTSHKTRHVRDLLCSHLLRLFDSAMLQVWFNQVCVTGFVFRAGNEPSRAEF